MSEELKKQLGQLMYEESVETILNSMVAILDDEATDFIERQRSLNRMSKAILEAAKVANEEGM